MSRVCMVTVYRVFETGIGRYRESRTMVAYAPMSRANGTVRSRRGAPLLVLLVVLGGGCRPSSEEPAGHAEQEPAAKTSPAAPLAASVVRPNKDGLLDECDDFTIARPQGALEKADAETSLVDALIAEFLQKNPGTSRVDKRCGDLFQAFPTVATCV